jgi:hypothetical protein
MQLLGDRKFVEVPGESLHELPPLLINDAAKPRLLNRVMDMASAVIDKEDLVPSHVLDEVAAPADVGRRKMELAVNLVETYLSLRRHWYWGDGILEWIRQCEITFESRADLRPLLHPDVWPHAGRASFVILLEDKDVDTAGIAIERAVGLRLTFRQPPPLACCSDQFLLYLNSPLAETAFHRWADMNPAPVSCLPPERFQVHVVKM